MESDESQLVSETHSESMLKNNNFTTYNQNSNNGACDSTTATWNQNFNNNVCDNATATWN